MAPRSRDRGRSARGRGGDGRGGGPRGGTSHVHPELAAPGDPAEYWMQAEAERYHRTPKAGRVQAELTQSAVALGHLLPRRRGDLQVMLDLGAGGGLSTVTCQALAASARDEEGRRGSPPFVIGFDTSAPMLAAAAGLDAPSLSGIRVPAIATAGTEVSCSQMVDVSEGLKWAAARGDRVLADISQPLPLRRNVADAVLSVSAVQWLVEARHVSTSAGSSSNVGNCGETCASDTGVGVPLDAVDVPSSGEQDCKSAVPQPRLARLFTSLRHCLRPPIPSTAGCSAAGSGGRIAMQFYPIKGDADFGARALRDAARSHGFLGAEVVLDFPHGGGAKKWVLTASRQPEKASCRGNEEQHQDMPDVCLSASTCEAASATLAGEPWCALCWPVVAARCALQQSSPRARTCDAPRGGSSECPAILARMERQHAEVALRLLRCGRRLLLLRGEGGEASGDQDGNAAAVRDRVAQQLHPLQLELAVALAQLIDGEMPCNVTPLERKQQVAMRTKADAAEDSDANAECVANPRKCPRQADPVEPVMDVQSLPHPVPGPQTKTELRALVEARLPDLLSLLHRAPSTRWTVPPPPLGAADAARSNVDGV